MAQPAGTFSTYDNVNSIREDFMDILTNLDPFDTPLQTAAQKDKMKNTYKSWSVEDLNAVDSSNARIEGDDAGTGISAATERPGNYSQISDKVVIVTGTNEAVDSAGKKSEIAHQTMMRMRELKRDMETILTSNQVAVAGNDTTARQLHGLEGWYTTNVSRGAGGANGNAPGITGADAAATDGTARVFSETLLTDVLSTAWDNGAMGIDTIMVGKFNRGKISTFSGNATPVVDANNAKREVVNTVKIYNGDYHTLKVMPNRFQRERTAHLIDPSLVAVDFLRPVFMKKLGDTGDSEKRHIITEYTLRVTNEQGHAVIADLTTS